MQLGTDMTVLPFFVQRSGNIKHCDAVRKQALYCLPPNAHLVCVAQHQSQPGAQGP